ncbi:cupin domain-containing protein [Bifidobacterium sp. ESL0728]|uniref:cupin domain-containing protein n=1 Tax=Bifidobacterium sp. ESL0728 TaxID=2983220 RepID=UPI0023F8F07E|nr:cupin domain-containing protein [Bifidobacterium sp. ESL0728]WEV59464.1 cupin domain-containing protein [Bifidobacterium sp. ESL0728]
MSVAFEDMSEYAQHVVKALDLEAHPEGGWYRQTWLSLQAAAGTATKQAAERGDAQRGIGTKAASADSSDTDVSHSDNTYAATADDLESMKATEGRPLASLIYFLLAEGDASAWHKVDATEIWLWHGPATVGLELGGYGDAPADESGRTLYTLGQGLTSTYSTSDVTTSTAHSPETKGNEIETVSGTTSGSTATLNAAADPSIASAATPIGQVVIPEGCWQRTVPGKGDALVSCVVSPGFTFDGFTLE